MKKILITGATGGLGYDVYNYLRSKKKYELYATGRNKKQHQVFENFKSIDLSEKNVTELYNIFGDLDVIIHCSALATDNGLWDEYQKHNIDVTSKIVLLAKKMKNCRIIYISSPSIYFNGFSQLDVEEDIEIKQDKISDYALSKFYAEQSVKMHDNFHILRPRAIFGENDTVLLPRIKKILKNKMFLCKKGNVLQDFTYVKNVSHAIYLCVESEQKNVIMNITNQEPMFLSDVLNIIADSENKKINIKNLSYRILYFFEIYEKILDNFEIRKGNITFHGLNSISHDMTLNNKKSIELGYRPLYDMKTALNLTLYGEKND